MLLNGKAEELSRYSKLKYNAQLLIQKAHELWEYSALQIRCIYLIADLAKREKEFFYCIWHISKYVRTTI